MAGASRHTESDAPNASALSVSHGAVVQKFVRAHEHAARHDQFGIEDIHQNRKPFPEIRARFAQNGDRVLVPLFRAFDDAPWRLSWG